MGSQTLKMSKQQISTMKNYYKDYLQAEIPYSIFRAKVNGTSITAYESGKVLFQGNNIDTEVLKWTDSATVAPSPAKATPTTTSLPKNFRQWPIIGSDEVGNGSYFGALTVCAVYLAPAQMELIQTIGVKDSKQLTDAQIRELAWQIKEIVPYHLTVCNPDKYNSAIAKQYNAVSIKVSLHNFTINKLYNKLNETQRQELQGVLIDQFTSENNYRKYLNAEKEPFTQKLYFAKQGESKHLAVACASIIARDAFLNSLETLGKPYNLVLPSGAGIKSDKVAANLIRQYGTQVLSKTAKLHFKNTEKAMKLARK